jgi:hypothetical protein
MGKQYSFYLLPTDLESLIDIILSVNLVPVLSGLRYSSNHPELIDLVGTTLEKEQFLILSANTDVSIGFTTPSLIPTVTYTGSQTQHLYIESLTPEIIEFSYSRPEMGKLDLSRFYLDSGYYLKDKSWVNRSPELIRQFYALKRKLLKTMLEKRKIGNYLYCMSKKIAEELDLGNYKLSVIPECLILTKDNDI